MPNEFKARAEGNAIVKQGQKHLAPDSPALLIPLGLKRWAGIRVNRI